MRYLIFITLYLSCGIDNKHKNMNANNQSLDHLWGIWQFSHDIDTLTHPDQYLNNTYTFVLDSQGITLKINVISTATDKIPKDGVLKLKVMIKDSNLYYLPPVSTQWQYLVSLEEDYFFMLGNGKKRFYKKVKPEDVPSWNQELLRENIELYNY
jgi:hypothetical protein